MPGLDQLIPDEPRTSFCVKNSGSALKRMEIFQKDTRVKVKEFLLRNLGQFNAQVNNIITITQ